MGQQSSIQQDILEICHQCLSIKSQMTSSEEGIFRCYVGGGRQYHPHDEKPYTRTIYLGSGSRRYDQVPEDIIDLNEVYTLYKRQKKITDWEEHPFHPSFEEAVQYLRKENYFLILDFKDIMNNDFDVIFYGETKAEDHDTDTPHDKTLRFIKLNPDKSL
ncbi:MAG: hypothetical protein IEMM0008_1801 [bacterium]|nr:MAG: hypothetical protein IEMM0008_1801 [bacterium]